MITNYAYSAAIALGMERAVMRMQPTLRLANKTPLPTSAQEMTEYVECLLDIREESSLSLDEACRLIYQEQGVNNNVTSDEWILA